jgi:hypothetical protein
LPTPCIVLQPLASAANDAAITKAISRFMMNPFRQLKNEVP